LARGAVLVRREGWYRLTQPELIAAGLDNSVDPRFLRLFAEGREQSIRIAGATDGPGGFGSEGSIEFYATGIDTPYSDTRVYWLVAGNKPGKRVVHQPASETEGEKPSSYPYFVELKQRTTYFAALLKKNTDNFFGALVSSTPVDEVLNARNIAPTPGQDIRLAIVLQGVVEGAPHDVRVGWNGTTLGELNFVGQDQGKISLDVPRELVQEGANTVTLTAQAGDNDLSLVDTIKLEYPHTYTAESDTLKFTAEAGEHVTIDGFTHAPKRLVDITSPADPVELTPDVQIKDGQFELEVSVPWSRSGVHSLLAVAEEQIAHPFELVRNHPSRWHSAQSGDEVLMISSEQFASELAPLRELRRSQGKSAAVVLIDDLYDEFNFGERSPDVIRDLLKTATERWQHKPKYVLLVGDASVDPRNYLGFGSFDFVPTKIVITSELKTASDDWFSDFENAGLGQIPTGRLPVRTAEEADTVVAKILGYERDNDQRSHDHGDWINQALLVADRDDTVDFTRDTKSVEALLPKAMKVTSVLASSLDANTARQEILTGINTQIVDVVTIMVHGRQVCMPCCCGG